MLKRKMLILGALCILTLILAACGGGGGGSAPSGGGSMFQFDKDNSSDGTDKQTKAPSTSSDISALPTPSEAEETELIEEIMDSQDRGDWDDSLVESDPDDVAEDGQISNIIELGVYEQDNDLSNGPEPIEWLILDMQDDMIFVVSRYIIDKMQYSSELPQSGGITWESCELRGWLNGDFLDSAFSDAERERILPVTVSTRNNVVEGTKGGNDTTDQIFLLAAEEVSKYLSNEENRHPGATEYVKGQSDISIWWLRTPGRTQIYAAYVSPSPAYSQRSGINPNGDGATVYNGVRPAMWIGMAG